MDLIKKVKEKQQIGLLDYKWEARLYVAKTKNKLTKQYNDLFYVIVSPFIYLSMHKKNIGQDKSLSAVCQLCTDFDHIIDVEHNDQCLSYLAKTFNELTDSSRSLHMCYDCGTVARGVFFQLIKAYRGQFVINVTELQRIKDDYFMQRYKGTKGVDVLKKYVHTIHQNCLFLCALQLGKDFGHIYIIEKFYINEWPRFRIYQSCLDAYLLVDYIECMDYGHDLSAGIDIDQHLDALYQLLSTPTWTLKEINLFIHWYKFYPSDGESKDDSKLFTCTYIIF